MLFNFREFFRYLYASYFRGKDTPARLSTKRFLLVSVIFLLYPVWQLYLRLGFVLDEVFYPAYRQQSISEPIFIVGNFRSGTTFLHRLLLGDRSSTALKTWEIFFAPSISYRKLFRAIIRISRLIGSPIRWLVRQFNKPIEAYSYMHRTGLDKIEEDSHLLYQVWSSYNLFALFPFSDLAQKYIYYDQLVPPQHRKTDFTYYRDIIRRHIFLHGGKRYISKNPDFSPAVETILDFFPDAKFINIIRRPEDMLPSTINMWANHWHTFGSPREAYPLQDTLISHAKHWYTYPHQVLQDLPEDRYVVLSFADFVHDPKKVLETVYARFGMDVAPDYARFLEQETIRSRQYESPHTYSMQDMGLESEQVRAEFYPLLEVYPEREALLKRDKELV